ncbi:hypothetical protein TSTA_075020, partial [Talaromyces stipitatus ATCC 10500]
FATGDREPPKSYCLWRSILVSFDVKGAYNGVFKERLLQRLKARGIPDKIFNGSMPPVRDAYHKDHRCPQYYFSSLTQTSFSTRSAQQEARPSAEANRSDIQAIINRALDWEKRGGATFEGDKTAMIYRAALRSQSKGKESTRKK